MNIFWLSDAIAYLQRVDNIEHSVSYQAPMVNDGSAGRPACYISHDQLNFFLTHGFTGPAIANMLGVPLRTVRRRISQYGLFKEGELKRRNIMITRARCREVLRRLDPIGVVDRLRSLCYRRKYSVYGPLALWHVDGNHKLIR